MGKGQVLEIITVDGSRAGVLRRKAKPAGKVPLAVQRLIEDMVATMRAANGVGRGAPRVGEGKRVLVAEVEERLVTLVDPALAHAEGEEVATEACLSIPGVIGPVRRGGRGEGEGEEPPRAGRHRRRRGPARPRPATRDRPPERHPLPGPRRRPGDDRAARRGGPAGGRRGGGGKAPAPPPAPCRGPPPQPAAGGVVPPRRRSAADAAAEPAPSGGRPRTRRTGSGPPGHGGL